MEQRPAKDVVRHGGIEFIFQDKCEPESVLNTTLTPTDGDTRVFCANGRYCKATLDDPYGNYRDTFGCQYADYVCVQCGMQLCVCTGTLRKCPRCNAEEPWATIDELEDTFGRDFAFASMCQEVWCEDCKVEIATIRCVNCDTDLCDSCDAENTGDAEEPKKLKYCIACWLLG